MHVACGSRGWIGVNCCQPRGTSRWPQPHPVPLWRRHSPTLSGPGSCKSQNPAHMEPGVLYTTRPLANRTGPGVSAQEHGSGRHPRMRQQGALIPLVPVRSLSWTYTQTMRCCGQDPLSQAPAGGEKEASPGKEWGRRGKRGGETACPGRIPHQLPLLRYLELGFCFLQPPKSFSWPRSAWRRTRGPELTVKQLCAVHGGAAMPGGSGARPNAAALGWPCLLCVPCRHVSTHA